MEGFKQEIDDFGISNHSATAALILDDDLDDVCLDAIRGVDGDEFEFDDCPAPENISDVERHLQLLSSSDSTDESDKKRAAATSTPPPTKVSNAPTLAPVPVTTSSSSTSSKAPTKKPTTAGRAVPKPPTKVGVVKKGAIDFEKVLSFQQRQDLQVTLNPRRDPKKPVCLFINYLGTRLPPPQPQPTVALQPTAVPTMSATSYKKGFTPSSRPTDPPVVSPEPRKRPIMMKSQPAISAIAATDVYHSSLPTPIGSSDFFHGIEGPKLKRTKGKKS